MTHTIANKCPALHVLPQFAVHSALSPSGSYYTHILARENHHKIHSLHYVLDCSFGLDPSFLVCIFFQRNDKSPWIAAMLVLFHPYNPPLVRLGNYIAWSQTLVAVCFPGLYAIYKSKSILGRQGSGQDRGGGQEDCRRQNLVWGGCSQDWPGRQAWRRQRCH